MENKDSFKRRRGMQGLDENCEGTKKKKKDNEKIHWHRKQYGDYQRERRVKGGREGMRG